MPELPEVETVRISLLPLLVGRAIVRVEVGDYAGVLGPMSADQFSALLSGQEIADIRRRGKYLLVDFTDASGFIVHLRMTGSLTHQSPGAARVRFEHLVFHLDDGSTLRFADQRKFGRITFRPASDFRPLESRLGPEPLARTFDSRYLAKAIANRTAPIKALLLDQRLIAGIGNIYADEALYRSRIHPMTQGGALTPAQVGSLVRSVKHVLRSGVEHRGTSFSSYRDGRGEAGSNQHELRVYGRGRTGEPCLRCGRSLTWSTVGGRTSHYCPHCQPLSPSAAGSRQ